MAWLFAKSAFLAFTKVIPMLLAIFLAALRIYRREFVIEEPN